MPNPVVKILVKKSYLAMVRNAAKGENYMFQNKYALVNGVEQDITDGGSLSCAFFLSAVLYINKLIKDMHANMAGLEKDLEASGWVQISQTREGAVVVWEPRAPLKERSYEPTQLHAGISVGGGRVVSNASSSTLIPAEFPEDYDGGRKILRIWWHPELDAS